MKPALKKLSFVIAAMYLFIAAKAQIVYTDVNPDSAIIANQSYNVDLNNDGIADFTISDSTWSVFLSGCGGASEYKIKITPLHNDADLSDASNHPYALSANSAIAPDMSAWITTSNQTLVQLTWACGRCGGEGYCLRSTISGHWYNITNGKYVGLKLIKGADTYYGWVRLSTSSSFTVQDYAFNNTPNMPILAGQKTYFTWVAMDSISPMKNLYCPSDTLQIKYTALGKFKASNIFKVQLSDSGGSFENPVVIGSIKSTDEGGIINAEVPLKTITGSHYSIRVVSSNPSTDSIYGIKTGIIIGAGITAENNYTAFCEGSSTTLLAPSGYSYKWLKNGKKIKGETGYSLTATTSGNYSCIIKACGSDTSNTIAITVYPLPKAIVFASGPTTFCAPGSVTLSDTVDNQAWTYQWNGIEGATKSSYTADSTGNYFVQVITKKGCGQISPGIIVIAAQPPGGVIGTIGDTSICIGDSTGLDADNNDHEDNSYKYQWKKNNQNIQGAINEVYYAKTAGTYTCMLTNVCGTATTAGRTITTKQCLATTSQIDNAKTFSASVFTVAPNPFSNTTIISFTLQQAQQVSLAVYDMNGRLIKTLADAQMQPGKHQLTWNAKDEKGGAVTAGIYLLKLQTGDYTKTKNISVIH